MTARAHDALSRLRDLERIARQHGEGLGPRKLTLLEGLDAAHLPAADAVDRLHEVLCYLRALPDDAPLLAQVKRMLEAFADRADLRRHREALADRGIVTTDVHYPFYAPMARWLVRRWPGRLRIDWSEPVDDRTLRERIYLLSLDAETPGLDNAKLTGRQWIERMKGPGDTDAEYLVRRFARVRWNETVRDVLFDELGLSFVLQGDETTPSRTLASVPRRRIHFQASPLEGGRPDLAKEVRRPPKAIRTAGRREGRRLVDLAREAMVVRHRALDAFAGGDPGDVRVVDCGDGLEFAVIGQQPAWRMLLESVYGWLILRNGVATGYVLTSALFRSSEIALNVFSTWRGGDAAWVYGRVLATTRALFGTETFTVYPYQLGHGNREGLESGAWWFYQKLGFRPRDPEVLALMKSEQSKIAKNPRHRSSLSTLERLARANVYLETARRRRMVIGTFPADRLGLRITDSLARRFGSERGRAERVLADEMGEVLGATDWRSFPIHKRKAWLSWSPLLRILPGVERWSRAEKRALVKVVRAKGGVREGDYVHLFDAHPKLGRALVSLASRGS